MGNIIEMFTENRRSVMSNTPIKPGVSVASSSSSPVPAKGKQRRRERKAPLRSKAQQSDDFTASLILPDKAVFSLTSQSLSINAYLSHLPSEFFPRFSALRILHLNGCGLKRLPPQIRELVELCYLDLTHNWLNMLPCQLHEMWTLEALKVDYHRMMRLDGPACLRITPENVKDGGLTNGAGPPRLTELASRSILRHIRPTDLEPSTFGELDIPPTSNQHNSHQRSARDATLSLHAYTHITTVCRHGASS